MSPAEIDAWATGWIAATEDQVDTDHPLWWTIDNFQQLIFDEPGVHPEDAWLCILRVLSMNPSGRVISNLAAGPLEDLVASHGRAFIDRIEQQAGKDAHFKDLMGGVWKNESDSEVWARFEKARGDKRW